MGGCKLYLQLSLMILSSTLHSLTCAPPRPTPPWPPRPCTADTGPAWHGRRGSPGTTWLGLGRVCNVYLNNHICPLELATDIREVSDSRQGAFSGYCEIFADLCCRLCCPPSGRLAGYQLVGGCSAAVEDSGPHAGTPHAALSLQTPTLGYCRQHYNITTYDIIFV